MARGKFVRRFALTGVLVSLVLLGFELLLRSDVETYSRVESVKERVFLVLWPSSLWLMVAQGWNASSLLILALSMLANAGVYALIGLAVWWLRRLFTRTVGTQH